MNKLVSAAVFRNGRRSCNREQGESPVRKINQDVDFGVIRRMRREKVITWRQSDGKAVSCEEKLRVLDDNLAEIRQMCQDAFEDALLMGCDEAQVRHVFASVIASLRNPYVPER